MRVINSGICLALFPDVLLMALVGLGIKIDLQMLSEGLKLGICESEIGEDLHPRLDIVLARLRECKKMPLQEVDVISGWQPVLT